MSRTENNIQSVGLTVLVDNSIKDMHLKAEHGVSYLVEKDGSAILFDTGQSNLLLQNAKTLGIDLSCIIAVVLSNGLRDHTGGLLDVLKLARGAPLYAHPDVFAERYAISHNGTAVPMGIPYTRDEVESVARVVLSDKPMEIIPGVWTTGQIPRHTDFESPSERFFADEQGTQVDEMNDDMALLVETENGLAVIVGCAHSGTVNILNHAAKVRNRSEIYAAVGGFHLDGASQNRIDRTCKAFKHLEIRKIGLAHCTGVLAIISFFTHFPEGSFICYTGIRMPL